ncbi:hypothetical protein C8R44DRAFT_754137 [Mycena epipterygia]|nr:hypothetical protein C8R44DRAFT_754137 [Mycena epipterygia]
MCRWRRARSWIWGTWRTAGAAAEHALTGLESEWTRAVPSLLVIVELMLVSTQTQIEERAGVDFACGATHGGESGMAQASRLVRVRGGGIVSVREGGQGNMCVCGIEVGDTWGRRRSGMRACLKDRDARQKRMRPGERRGRAGVCREERGGVLRVGGRERVPRFATYDWCCWAQNGERDTTRAWKLPVRVPLQIRLGEGRVPRFATCGWCCWTRCARCVQCGVEGPLLEEESTRDGRACRSGAVGGTQSRCLWLLRPSQVAGPGCV